jgi:hypothetical protein
MWPISRGLDATSGAAARRRRRPNRRALVIALAVHGLLLTGMLHWRAAAPVAATAEHRTTVVMVRLARPEPPARPIPEPKAAGVKLAARPSPGLPTARTLERQLATLPKTEIEPDVAQAVVASPLPNLASIDVVAGAVGTGGTGREGAGAGSQGTGAGQLFEECAATPDRTLVADVYRLPRGSDSVATMRGRKPIKRVCLSQLDVVPRSFREGFPGMSGLIEWFGLDIRFTVNIAEAGTWDLVLQSDDGAVLSIDDVQVIDNDGLHKAQMKVARVRLAAGLRRFRVRYFQGPRESIALQLLWKRPEEADFSYIPRGLLGRPAAMTALSMPSDSGLPGVDDRQSRNAIMHAFPDQPAASSGAEYAETPSASSQRWR